MKSREMRGEVSALKPVGLAFAAVVAGLSPGKSVAAPEVRPHAPLEPAAQGNTYFVDHTNHPGFEEDASLVVGESEPVAVFGEVAPAAGKKQRDLFEL